MILEMKNIRKSFGGLEVLKDISMNVDSGEVVSIIGPSGSGKSTLLRCATFLEQADAGTISYMGKSAMHTNEKGEAVYVHRTELNEIKRYFGLVFQQFNLFPHYSVLKNITDAPLHVQKRPKEEVHAEAMELLRKAADKGQPDAENALGVMYYTGDGVERDYGRAVGYFRMAAGKGQSDAECFLGTMYYFGEGVERDPALALEFFRKSAAKGNPSAQYYLGLIYETGNGMPRDLKLAAEEFGKSASQNHAGSQYHLAVLYMKGEGVGRDLKKARTLLEASSGQGNVQARQALEKLDARSR